MQVNTIYLIFNYFLFLTQKHYFHERHTHRSIIQKKYEEKGIKIQELADKLDTVRQNVYKIFKKGDINTHLLLKLCEILEHDFFQYFSDKENQSDFFPTVNSKADTPDSFKNPELLNNEIIHLKKELELKDKIIMLLEKSIREIEKD